jgi:hypothetical protein
MQIATHSNRQEVKTVSLYQTNKQSVVRLQLQLFDFGNIYTFLSTHCHYPGVCFWSVLAKTCMYPPRPSLYYTWAASWQCTFPHSTFSTAVLWPEDTTCLIYSCVIFHVPKTKSAWKGPILNHLKTLRAIWWWYRMEFQKITSRYCRDIWMCV